MADELDLTIDPNSVDLGQFRVTTPFYNYHTGNEDGQWNNSTSGLGLSYTTPNKNWTVGGQVYDNSYDKTSTMLYGQRNKALNDYFRVNAGAGIANNYEDELYNYKGYTGFPFLGASFGKNNGLNFDVRTTAPFNTIWGGEAVTNFGISYPF